MAAPIALDRWIELPSRRQALRRLMYAVDRRGDPALIVGMPGVGKSRLALRLAEELGRIPLILDYPIESAEELLVRLDDDPSPGRLGRVRARLAAERGPLLIVEEAHAIAVDEAWEALRLLPGGGRARMVLVGGPATWERLAPEWVDRLGAHAALGALSLDETDLYLSARWGEHAFEAPAMALLHRRGAGLPRRLDRLAELARLVAEGRGQARVDADCARIAAEAGRAGLGLAAASLADAID